MEENPYQSPDAPPSQRLQAKSVVALTILSLLSVPAGAIAGSSICTALAESRKNPIPDFLVAGSISCLVVVYLVLTIQQRLKGRMTIAEVGEVFSRSLAYLVLMLPFAFLFACTAGYICYGLATKKQIPGSYVSLITGFVFNLIMAGTALIAWRLTFGNRAAKP